VEILFDDDPKAIKYVDESTLCMMPIRLRRTQTIRN
jgi:hypothetical protein